MDTIIIHTETKKTKALVSFLKAFDISFEIKKGNKEEKPYNPEFVKMILEASKSNNRRVLDDAYKKELFGEL